MTGESGPAQARRKKIGIVAGVAVLAAALAGGGALTTLYTSVDGNEFRSTVPDAGQDAEGALLRLTGAPIDHDFDSATHSHQVSAEWSLENLGTTTAEFSGSFDTVADVDQELAEALVVQYGRTDSAGQLAGWLDAGTLAAPAEFGTVTGITSIDGRTTIPVHVRVLLEDPSLIASADPDEIGRALSVVADFTVSYLDPLGAIRP